MDLLANRELARIQAVLHVLRTQRDALSELSDITAQRALEESFLEALGDARQHGIATQDPVAVVRDDWQRMVRWSNRVQEALREVDELGQELSSGLAGHGAEGGGGSGKMVRPTGSPPFHSFGNWSTPLKICRRN